MRHLMSGKGKWVTWTLVGLLIAIGLYLVFDHGEHLALYLPFAFLLGCFFMHLFMHGGHGHSHNEENDKETKL